MKLWASAPRHPVFRLSVETSSNFPEGLLRDRHSLQVGPALEWILGLRDLFQKFLLFHLRVGIKNVSHFSAVLVPLH